MVVSDSKKRFANSLRSLVREKPLEAVTTQEIVKKAQLSRQTFYKLFKDKYDLAFWSFECDAAPFFRRYLAKEINLYQLHK